LLLHKASFTTLYNHPYQLKMSRYLLFHFSILLWNFSLHPIPLRPNYFTPSLSVGGEGELKSKTIN
jgi:hypothetical protein